MAEENTVSNIYNISVDTIEQLNSTKLPLARDVLSLYFDFKNNKKLSKNEALLKSVEAVNNVWIKAKLKTFSSKAARNKLLRLVEEFFRISAHKNINSLKQNNLEAKFQIVLDTLFDIASPSEFNELAPERQIFLLDQRDNRIESIDENGKVLLFAL